MPADTQLIPAPVLDPRTEADRIAARIARSIGGLNLSDAALIIEYGQSLAAALGNNWLIAPNCTSFTLSFGDQTQSVVPATPSLLQSGVTASAIQAALQILSSVGAGGVIVTNNGDSTFTASFSSTINPEYSLAGTASGGAATITITYQPNAIPDPLLPELSSARPAEAHVTMLTELERLSTFMLAQFNILPDANRIAFLRLLGTVLNPAIAATTTLQFVKTPDYLNIDVTIPAGTEVASLDQQTVVSTDADLDIPSGVLSATVNATSEVLGNTGRQQTNSLVLLRQSIAGIGSVSNVTPLSGGVDGESVPQAEIRARELVALGQHLGNVNEWSAFIFFQVQNRKGRITAFEGYNALFQQAGLGYLLLVVQDDVGAFPAQNILNAVSALIATRHVAGLQVSVTGPQFVSFDLSVNVTIAPGFGSGPLIAKATANLQSFYNPLTFPYGPTLDNQGNLAVRYISLSDIIGQVEQAGPQAISVKDVAGNFQISITINGVSGSNDVALTLGQLPQIGNITLNVVQ